MSYAAQYLLGAAVSEAWHGAAAGAAEVVDDSNVLGMAGGDTHEVGAEDRLRDRQPPATRVAVMKTESTKHANHRIHILASPRARLI